MKKHLLTIAGFDPSGGAGALLDVRVFESLGFRGCAVLTALTAQNPVRIKKIQPLPGSFLTRQYEMLSETYRFSGIKVGMAGSGEALAAALRILSKQGRIPRVIDPVLHSSSGVRLLEARAARRFLEMAESKASLITPNLKEASFLSGRTVRTPEEMEAAAVRIFEMCGIPCLVKGGHLKRETADILFDGKQVVRYRHPRKKKDVHGTGCFLSAAILSHLASGIPMKKACARGIDFTAEAITKAVRGGKGRYVFDLTG
jgi:hydroxymethylpyrimidine/phosphomethylpyrimidine kinase